VSICLQEQFDKALQTLQSGRFGEGIPDDVISSSGAQDDKALVEMSLSQVER